MNAPNLRNFLVLVVVILILAAAYAAFIQTDHRTATEKVGDAIHELPQGVGKATDELGDDRTPGQKLGDDLRHAGDKVKENSAPQ